MEPTDRDLLSLLERQAQENSSRPLYSFLDRNLSNRKSLTFKELYDSAVRVAADLQRRGLQRSPVALLYPHGPDFIIALFGAILAGAWPVPLTRARGQEWPHIFELVRKCGARAVLSLSSIKTLIPPVMFAQSKVQLFCTDTLDCNCSTADWQRPTLQPDDIAFIQYTSGSTSKPRGVIVTHSNVLHNSAKIRDAFSCSAENVGVSWLPFHHDMGLIGHVIQPLYASMHNYFLSPADFLGSPMRWLTAISRYGGTISGAPNFGYALCAAKIDTQQIEEGNLNLQQWRLAYCGSERIVPAALRRFARQMYRTGFTEKSFYPCYGMAESTLFVCGQEGLSVASQEGESHQYAGIGALQGDGSVVVVDTVSEEPARDGHSGEIWLKSESVSPGYFGDPEGTNEIFDQTLLDVSGYMRTGDIGFVRSGTLHFVGRLKNLIKRRGRSFYAEDIEAMVESVTAHRGVRRCAAFEVVLDATVDTTLKTEDALILLLEHDGKTPQQELDSLSKDVTVLVCDAIGIIPHAVHVLPKRSLPLTTSGKLQRDECRVRFMQSLVELTNIAPQAERSATSHEGFMYDTE